jgi:uncharacterized repeat protein (TIGR01451 family)
MTAVEEEETSSTQKRTVPELTKDIGAIRGTIKYPYGTVRAKRNELKGTSKIPLVYVFLLIIVIVMAVPSGEAQIPYSQFNVFTVRSVYNVGDSVQVLFQTGSACGRPLVASATIDVSGPVSYTYGPVDVVTGKVYTVTLSGFTPVPGVYNVKVTLSLLSLTYDVYQGYTSFQVVEAMKPVLTYVSVTGIPPGGPIYPGEESTVVVISNTGNAKAVAVNVVLEDLNPTAGLTIVSSDSPKNVGPLETAQWMVKVRADRPGEYSGMLRTYVGTERALEQAWTLEVSAPEIDVTNKDLSPGPDQIYLGDAVTVTCTLRNKSPVDATQVSVGVTTSDGLTVLDQSTITEIASQSDVKLVIKLKAEKTGNAWVQTDILSYGTTVQEDKTTFNISERPIWQQQWFLAAIGVAAVALIAAVIMLRRRRPKPPTLDLTQATAPSAPSSNMCPRCGKPLTYVQSHSR